VHFAEGDAIQALDQRAHALERPQFGSEAMGERSLQQCRAQAFELAGIQLCGSAGGHGAQRIDAAFIESRLPRVRRLPRNAHCLCRFGRCPARQHHSPSAHSLACGFVHSRHELILRSNRCSKNAPAANRLSWI
jgi:hypothetical protein